MRTIQKEILTLQNESMVLSKLKHMSGITVPFRFTCTHTRTEVQISDTYTLHSHSVAARNSHSLTPLRKLQVLKLQNSW